MTRTAITTEIKRSRDQVARLVNGERRDSTGVGISDAGAIFCMTQNGRGSTVNTILDQPRSVPVATGFCQTAYVTQRGARGFPYQRTRLLACAMLHNQRPRPAVSFLFPLVLARPHHPEPPPPPPPSGSDHPAASTTSTPPTPPPYDSARPLIVTKYGIVSASNYLASLAGAKVLE